MVPQVAGWDGSDDPDFRCEGCGQTSTVPRLGAEDDELLMHKTSMGGFDVVTPALERMSWPTGPLHPNHRLVLNSEFAAWIPFHGDIVYGGKTFSDGKAKLSGNSDENLIDSIRIQFVLYAVIRNVIFSIVFFRTMFHTSNSFYFLLIS